MTDMNQANRKRRARQIFVGLIGLAIGLMGAIILPFLTALLMAAVFAGALHPLHVRLQRRLRGRPRAAAALVTVGLILLLILPLSGIAAVVIKESVDGFRFVSKTLKQKKGVGNLVESLPGHLEGIANKILETFPRLEKKLESASLKAQMGEQSGAAAAAVGDVVSATGSVVFQTFMFLIAFYCFLVEGASLVAWMESVLPLQPRQATELLTMFRKTAVSVLTSEIATSGVQAIAALLGYLIAQVPQPFFFALLTFVIAFVPLVGAGSVCLAAAALLFLMGKIGGAIFLALWAVLVVGLVDNFIKPMLIKVGLEMHGVVVFFALLGGLATFGAIGLLLGPLIVAFFLTLLRIYRRDFGVGSV